MRLPDATARWAMLSDIPSQRTGPESIATYAVIAVKAPMLRLPFTTCRPPTSITAARPSLGRKPMKGV